MLMLRYCWRCQNRPVFSPPESLAWDGHYPLSGCASPGDRSFGMGIVEFATQIILRADMEGKRCIIVSLILPLAIQEKREAVLPASPSLER